MLPAGIVAAHVSGCSPFAGCGRSGGCPGTKRVAPLSAVKSVSAQMAMQPSGTWGLGSGIEPSSAWNGCASCPGSIAIAVSDATGSSVVEDPLGDVEHRREQRHLGEHRVAGQQVEERGGCGRPRKRLAP